MDTPRTDLPDLLLDAAGQPVSTPAQWALRREQIYRLMVPLAYGDLPPAPRSTRCLVLHTAVVRHLGGASLLSCGVEADGRFAFGLRVFVPPGPGPFPVLLNGDACWHYAGDEVLATVLGRGMAFAQFNRVEVAPDPAPGQADLPSGAHRLFPEQNCGALAAWAWAYHRAVDALLQLKGVDPARLAVVGHSRGGKAALLAGATDERIALTSANNSGAGGAGCFRWQGPGAETLADITTAFPHWFGPRLAQFAGREWDLPFDQHFLKALVAPRALLTTEALEDHWANPQGTWRTHLAAREVYTLLGARDAIAVLFRDGGHDHRLADWLSVLDFCDFAFRGGARAPALDRDPFPDLPGATTRVARRLSASPEAQAPAAR